MKMPVKDPAYDKPVDDDGRVSVISSSTLEEGGINGRNSVDTLDWHDPETYDADGNDTPSGNTSAQDTQPLLRPDQ